MSTRHSDRHKKETLLSADATLGGSPARFGLSISRVGTRDGSELKLHSGGVTVIVGGNNSGKSTFLRDIGVKLQQESSYNTLLVDNVELVRKGADSDAFAWLNANVGWDSKGPRPGFSTGHRYEVASESAVKRFLGRGNVLDGGLGQLKGLFVQQDYLHHRLEIVKPTSQRYEFDDRPIHPLHRLQDDLELFERMREYIRRIFRVEVTFDQLGESTRLRVGTTDVEVSPVDKVTREYARSLASLPALDEQGDGMKSLLGLLLSLVTSPSTIKIVDEPEAFLHPPQARIAGRVIGELAATSDAQIILATHDRNLLVGLLDSGAPVSVVRLDRRPNVTRVRQLDPESVRLLWNDPNLRYGNVLDGLFHRAVVLAEADGDCQFYAASLDAADSEARQLFSPHDILFLPVGGKSAMPRVAAALKAVSVPLVVVADLDLLNDRALTSGLVRALGGEWAGLDANYRKATEPFRRPRTPKTRGQVLALVQKILDSEAANDLYDKETADQLLAEIRVDRSPWQDLKDFGLAAFKGGSTRQAADELLSSLEHLGLVLVRDGELERLAPQVDCRKGTEWVHSALASHAFTNRLAQAHIACVAHALSIQIGIDESRE